MKRFFMINLKKKLGKMMLLMILMFFTFMFINMIIPDVKVQAKTKRVKKIEKEYKRFVKSKKFAKKMKTGWDRYFCYSKNIETSYGIADIDSNGIPELLVQSRDETYWACTLVYTYNWKKKRIRNVKFKDSICWSYGGISRYSPKYKFFAYRPLSNVIIYSKINKFKEKTKYMLYSEWDGNNSKYWINNKEVSEKRYYKYSKTFKEIRYRMIDINL